MTFTISSLNVPGTVINQLTIHSFEMGLYLAEVVNPAGSGFILNEHQDVTAQGRLKRFKSCSDVMQQLAKAQIKSAVLVHQSAYDEMVGQGAKVDNSLRLVII